ncbi:MAG: trypsin-like serine protease, partial [Thiohalocapsa sp.]
LTRRDRGRVVRGAVLWLLLGATAAEGLEGGQTDTEARFAAVVVLVGGPVDQCSATKIAARQFLTAGHCVVDTSSGELRPAFRANGTIKISGSVAPETEADFSKATVTNTLLAPAFKDGLERFISFKRKRIAAFTEQFAGTELLRRITEMEAKHHFTLRFPDAAVVEIDRDTAGIPVATIDAASLQAGDAVTLVGYGCAQLAHRREEHRSLPFGRRRWGHSQVIRVDAVNFYSYAAQLRTGTPSLCPGDSGGPVFHDGKVAGVHSTVFGISTAGGAHSNMSVNLYSLRDWEALQAR